MRLLQCDNGKFSLTKDLPPDGLPQYAILSHTWGPDSDEVTFRDLEHDNRKKRPNYKQKPGYKKIRFCAEQAARDGLRFFWIDTCCIDKTDNIVLSTSINSMFRWYQDATQCYVYLVDVSIPRPTSHSSRLLGTLLRKKQEPASPFSHSSQPPSSLWEQAFRNSRWFKRGWTLQELVAPASVEFFSKDGHRLGDKSSLEQQIHEITSIPIAALRGAALSEFDIEERFRWAVGRQTTHDEDLAYCLLGIFGVFMPLIYGEGKTNADRRLKKEIAEAMSSGGVSEHEEEILPQPFAMIPFRRDPDFVMRGDILDQIDKGCSEPAGRVALVGLGGIGKSQLAIEFAYQIEKKAAGTWVFWIHAGTRARVEEGFRAIADAVKLPERKEPKADIQQLIYTWLSRERNGRWIIVLDSADDADVFLATASSDSKPLVSYLPQSRNGSILVTTRNRDLARRLAGNDSIIYVGTMVAAEALLLLEKKLEALTNLGAATELVRALEYVPLAIIQAAGYIRAKGPRCSLEKYLADFREGERKRTKLLGHDGGDLRRDGSASNAILTTWQISFEHIYSKRRSAADLLSLMSFFDRQGIPESLLKPPDPTDNTMSEEESDSGQSGKDMVSEFEDDVTMLQDFCLITVDDNGTEFEMHGLVQLSTRKWLDAKGAQEKFKEQHVTRLAAAFPRGDYENWETCRKLFSHVEGAMGHKPMGEELEETWAILLFNGAWYAWLQGTYDTAERMAYKAKRSHERLLGPENTSTLSSISLYASVLRDRGQWTEAEKLFVQVMETSKTKLGADHPIYYTEQQSGFVRLCRCSPRRWAAALSPAS